jgi:heptosyltransferase-2
MSERDFSKHNIQHPDCSRFTGYKPCAPYKLCEECDKPVPVDKRILLVALEAQGAVLMTTALLHAIKKEYPNSCLFWLTKQESIPLLENNHLIDEVLPWNDESRMLLQQIKFDIVYSLDKSRYTGAFVNNLNVKKKFGFGLSIQGSIIPFNEGALYSYTLGLNDELKFHGNKLTNVEILHKTVELPYQGSKYILNLSLHEIEFRNQWAKEAGLSEDDVVIGFNTGCSNLFPNKKLTIEQHVSLINMLYDYSSESKIILLGGREDTERNIQIHKLCGKRPINTPTTEGLRKGIIYVDLSDIVISGDSLGMHIAIGLGKYVVVWFGLACAQEIDLFNRGEKVLSEVDCAPCWKRFCDDLKCIREISLQKIYDAVKKGIEVVKAEKSRQKTLSSHGKRS